MIDSFFGTKLSTSQIFDDQGNRFTVTYIKALPLTVTQVKSVAKDGYQAIQVAIGQKSNKSLTRPMKTHLKSAKLAKAPLFLKELLFKKDSILKPGDKINFSDVLSCGDKVQVTGITKGRGFAGVMKRWGFHGGPRTHGQSDRPRSPGSIGMRTTPGRVWKGKKMAGHYGVDVKTISGLQVINIDSQTDQITISGTVPGSVNGLVKLTKIGLARKPIKLPVTPSTDLPSKPEENKDKLKKNKNKDQEK